MMRMRNKPWAKPYLAENADFVLPNPAEYKGNWRNLLPYEEVRVEVGTGKGDYLDKMSQMNPEIGWIGIEKNTNVAALTVKKVVGRENVRFIAQDGENLQEWFGEGEIDVIHLNFSDPWPKKRNTKRRLSSTSFLNQYKTILKDNGHIILKSDNRKFFEFSLVEMTQFGFTLEEVFLDFRSEPHDEDAITEYEARFMGLGQPIYRAVFCKKG